MKVKDIMTKDVIYVDKDVDLKHVMDLMEKHEITKIPVVEDKKLIGVITDNIIAYKLGSIRKKGVPASRLHASSVTDKEFETVDPDTKVEDIIKTVGVPGPTMLNVTKNNDLEGVITKADLLHMVESKENIKTIMKTDIQTVYPDDRVVHARRIMIDNDIGRLPVTQKGELVGIVSDIDIAFAFADLKRNVPLGKQKHRLDKLLVEDTMKTPVIYTTTDTNIKKAASIMLEENIGALPIIENDKLIGIVTRTDLLKTL